VAVVPKTDQAPAKPVNPPSTPCERVQSEIAKYSDWDVNIMQAIAQAENRACNPARHNLTTSETHRRADGSIICVGSYGVLQVGCLHYQGKDKRDDLATNVRIAHKVYQHSGYNAWTQFNNKEYLKYLR
jgi:hypothetical protein